MREAAAGDPTTLIRAVYLTGLDRPDDEEHVLTYFRGKPWLELVVVDCTDSFLAALAGKYSMPDKRLAVREVYKAALEAEIEKFQADFIAQGTLYTDISESGQGYNVGSAKAQIKLHHNVGLGFSCEELAPLSECVKDTARAIGRSPRIGVPEVLLTRHPFPGPGLAIRIEGEVTPDKLRMVRQADGIFIEGLRRRHLYETIWQGGVTVTSSRATCVKGDGVATGQALVFWAFWSVNGFTAQAASLPEDFCRDVTRRICNEVADVGRVTQNWTSKPPGTIEWG